VRSAIADGRLVRWGGGSELARGFATLRLQSNRLQGRTEEQQCQSGHCTTDPVRLLCRMLRMAPACYRRFELAARCVDAPLQIQASILVVGGDWSREKVFRSKMVSCDGAAELAAALHLGMMKLAADFGQTWHGANQVVRMCRVPTRTTGLAWLLRLAYLGLQHGPLADQRLALLGGSRAAARRGLQSGRSVAAVPDIAACSVV